jgi:hypothetical protein
MITSLLLLSLRLRILVGEVEVVVREVAAVVVEAAEEVEEALELALVLLVRGEVVAVVVAEIMKSRYHWLLRANRT